MGIELLTNKKWRDLGMPEKIVGRGKFDGDHMDLCGERKRRIHHWRREEMNGGEERL